MKPVSSQCVSPHFLAVVQQLDCINSLHLCLDNTHLAFPQGSAHTCTGGLS